MSQLRKNAIAFLQKKFPVATVLNQENDFCNLEGNVIFKIWPMLAQDFKSGIKQRGIAIEDFGSRGELLAIVQGIIPLFDEMGKSIYVKLGNANNPMIQEIDTLQMALAPRIILYTNKLCVPIDEVYNAFNSKSILIDIIDESKMHKTLFISYGGPDENIVKQINSKIKSAGVTTWFFPVDAQPGHKLHRVMHDGVNKHDKVLLICSKNSLSRPGVLNEIERVLEREAKEGGSEILIPVTLDDFVYSDWAPTRTDVASQVRARVISKIETGDKEFDQSIEKIVKALKK
jgi:hypothetical protein